MTQKTQLLALATVAAALVGCSGGAGGNSAPTLREPQILGPGAVEFNQDSTSPAFSFKITDNDTAAGQLEIGLSTANAELIPLGGLRLEGSGEDRTLRITPAAESVGSTTISLSARDAGGLMNSVVVAVKVNPVLVSFLSLTNEAFVKAETADESKVFGVTVQADVDNDENAFDALLQ